MTDVVTVALIVFAGQALTACISYSNNRQIGVVKDKLVQVSATAELTHSIVNSQKTAMEKLLSDQTGTISERDATIDRQQQQLHDVGAKVQAPTAGA